MRDLIDRQEAIDEIDNLYTEDEDIPTESLHYFDKAVARSIRKIKDLPSVDEKGDEWREINVKVKGYGAIFYQHDCCCNIYNSPYNYCPNCGTKMINKYDKKKTDDLTDTADDMY